MDVKKFSVSEDLVVGQKTMDEQHVEFFNRLNSLIGAAVDKKSMKEIQNFIRFLAEYIQKHLSMEEKLMQKYGYTDFENHKKQHDFFRKSFTSIMDEFSSGNLSIAEFVSRLEKEVGEWFENHITKVDRIMAKFLVEKGAANES